MRAMVKLTCIALAVTVTVLWHKRRVLKITDNTDIDKKLNSQMVIGNAKQKIYIFNSQRILIIDDDKC